MLIAKIIKHKVAKLNSNLNSNNSSRVIYYHDLHMDGEKSYYPYSTPISLFLKHVDKINDLGFEIVDRITKPTNQILITFDDGYRGVLSFIDIIKELKIHIKIFMITSLIGDKDYLSKKEIIFFFRCSHS